MAGLPLSGKDTARPSGKAKIQPLGMLKTYLQGQSECQAASGIPVRQAMEELGIPPEVVALVVVNGEQQTKDYVLQDGDVVRLLAVIGGG